VYRPRELGLLLTRLCRQRRWSAARASRKAGLSINQVRNIQRGFHRPSPRVCEAILEALTVDEKTAAEFRRLAGIEPDPASSPESRKARLDHWPLLTYLLVNHVLLPRLDLADTLARLRARRSPAAEYLTAAASAPSGQSFSELALTSSPAPRALLALLEKRFGYLTAARLQHHHPLPRFRIGRLAATNLLIDFASPRESDYEAFDRALNAGFAAAFAGRLFPLVYHQACRCWPFEKVYMSYALHGESCQRAVYAQARGLAAPADFDQVLTGCAGRIDRGQPTRARSAPDGRSESSLPQPAADPPAPPGNPDYIFDHLDRCEFLDRFPLLKLDLDGACRLACSLDLPSLEAHRVRLEAAGVAAPAIDAKLRCEDEVLEAFPFTGPESFIVRLIGQTFRAVANHLIFAAAWPALDLAARDLELARMAPDVAQLLATMASRSGHR
jgi:transcriptional regulator with XRE-family HTH domain